MPYKTDKLTAAIRGYIVDSGVAKEADKEGISQGFLANYIIANIDEIILREITEAIACGELGCDECGTYYNYNNCGRDDQYGPICPECKTLLESVSCSNCGSPQNGLYTDSGYTGKYLNGKIVCQSCERLLMQLPAKGENL